MNVLIIENSSPFTYNLAQEFKKRDCEVTIYRDDNAKLIENAIKKSKFIIIMSKSEESINVIQANYGNLPILCVGSGLYAALEAFDGAASIQYQGIGKVARINHDGKTIFKRCSNPFTAVTYTHLIASDVPYEFEVSARDKNDNVMAIRHKENFLEAVQFDPSSLLTLEGSKIIDNFLKEFGKK
jgi:anthranilate/para-aminobenzoate synthase component II